MDLKEQDDRPTTYQRPRDFMMSRAKGVSEAASSTVIARQKRTVVSRAFQVLMRKPVELIRLSVDICLTMVFRKQSFL